MTYNEKIACFNNPRYTFPHEPNDTDLKRNSDRWHGTRAPATNHGRHARRQDHLCGEGKAMAGRAR